MNFRMTLLKIFILGNSDDFDFEITKMKVFDFNKQVTVNFFMQLFSFEKRIIIPALCADSPSC